MAFSWPMAAAGSWRNSAYVASLLCISGEMAQWRNGNKVSICGGINGVINMA